MNHDLSPLCVGRFINLAVIATVLPSILVMAAAPQATLAKPTDIWGSKSPRSSTSSPQRLPEPALVSPPSKGGAKDPPNRHSAPNDPPPRKPTLVAAPATGNVKAPPNRPVGRPIKKDPPPKHPIIGRPVPNDPPTHPVGHPVLNNPPDRPMGRPIKNDPLGRPAPNDPPSRPIIGRPAPNDPPGRPIGHPVNDPPVRPIGRPAPNDPLPSKPPLISPPYIGTGQEPPGRPIGHPVKPPVDDCRKYPRKCYSKPPVVYAPRGCDRYYDYRYNNYNYNWPYYGPRNYGRSYSPWTWGGFNGWGCSSVFNSSVFNSSVFPSVQPDYRRTRSLALLLEEGLHPKVAQALWEFGIEPSCIRRTLDDPEDRDDGFYRSDLTANDFENSAVVDICTTEMSDFQIRQMLEKLGQKGFAAWYRQPGRDGWGLRQEAYIYAIYAAVPLKFKWREQVQDYLQGRNGLSDHAPYDFYQWSDRARFRVNQLFEDFNS